METSHLKKLAAADGGESAAPDRMAAAGTLSMRPLSIGAVFSYIRCAGSSGYGDKWPMQ